VPSPNAPKLEWFAAFAAFAEHRSFTRAAERLHISQPALHAQVRKLSDALGVALYARRGRTLALTPDGEQVAIFARDLQRRTDAFLGTLGHGAPNEPVTLAAGEGAMLYLVDEAIRRFARAGTAPLSLLTGDREATLAALRSAQAHVGVVAGDVPGDLRSEPIDDVPHLLAMPKQHPLASRAKVQLAALAEEPLVVGPPGSPLRARLNDELGSRGLALRVAVEARGWELTLHFVGLGLGLAVVNGCCRLPRGLVARPVVGLPRVRYWVLTRPELAAHRPTLALVETIQAHGRAWRTRARAAASQTASS